MKYKFIVNIFTALFLLICMVGNVQSGVFDPESAGSMFVVKKIDTRKKVITVDDGDVFYTSATRFVNKQGEKLTVNDVFVGGAVRFRFKSNERFVFKPTAVLIYVY